MMTFLGTTMFNKPPRQVTNSNLSFFFAIRIRRCTYLGNREHRTYLPRYAKLLQKATSFYNINLFILIKKTVIPTLKLTLEASNYSPHLRHCQLVTSSDVCEFVKSCIRYCRENLQMPRNLDDNKKLIPPVEYQYSGRENTSYTEIPL